MKNNTMKKALSLFLAIVMIALALPLTILPVVAAEAAVGDATTIKYAKMYSYYSDGWDMHVSYGSVAGMIDGDPYNEAIDNNGDGDYKDDGEVEGNYPRSSRPYYESDALDGKYTSLYVDSAKETRTYYGYAVFELNAMSALTDMTIWIAGNGYNEEQAARWSNPASSWGINNGYEILLSSDGEAWTYFEDFTDMCGDGTDKGANFPSEGDEAYATKTVDGYLRVGHKIDLGNTEAKYIAIAVTELSKDGCIDIGDVTVNGTVVTPNAAKQSPAEIYAAAKDGDLLQTVNFKDTSWNDDYKNSDNWNTYYDVSEDGSTVRHLLHSSKTFGANNKRAMWGGIAEEDRLPLDNNNKYTIYFDADFGKSGQRQVIMGIQLYDNETVAVDGFGYNYWYSWNTKKVSESDGNDGYDKWNYNTDITKTDMHSFAIEVDAENDEMTLYVSNADGSFDKVRTLTYDGADISGSLKCAIYLRSEKGTVDSNFWAEISNLQIYKGLIARVEVDKAAEYANAQIGDLLQTINFNSHYWKDEFADENNKGADVVTSNNGSTAKLTVHSNNNKRAMWGGLKDAYCYPLREVTEVIENPDDPENPTYVYGKNNNYTLVFDVDFGNNGYNLYGIGIQIDGSDTLLIDGFGLSYLYDWNARMVNKSDTGDYKWNYHTDVDKGEKHTFAVEIDTANNVMTLYVASADGTFEKVRTLEYEGAELYNTLSCRIYTRNVSGSPDETYWSEISDIKIYKGLVAGQVQNSTGASVRMDVPTGIRFSSEFRKSMIDDLKATYGDENVKLGMIITPTDYITDNGVDFEMAALDACTAINGAKYVKIEANTILDDGAYYVVNCALVNIQEGNYARSFSARAYIEVDGEVFKYADFDLENNSRSIAEVAAAAYSDVEDEADEEYQYPVVVGGVTKYSCYTDEQRALFEGFFQ